MPASFPLGSAHFFFSYPFAAPCHPSARWPRPAHVLDAPSAVAGAEPRRPVPPPPHSVVPPSAPTPLPGLPSLPLLAPLFLPAPAGRAAPAALAPCAAFKASNGHFPPCGYKKLPAPPIASPLASLSFGKFHRRKSPTLLVRPAHPRRRFAAPVNFSLSHLHHRVFQDPRIPFPLLISLLNCRSCRISPSPSPPAVTSLAAVHRPPTISGPLACPGEFPVLCSCFCSLSSSKPRWTILVAAD